MQGRKAMLVLHGKQAMNEDVRSAVGDLRDSGWVLDVRVTWEAGDAQRLVAEALAAGYSHIVAGGGDGTLRDVAEAMGLAATQASLALLPLGTANDFAKAAGIPLEPASALALLNVAPQPIDLGQAGDQLFLNMATGGFGSQVTANTSEDLKKVLGAAAYLFTGLSRFSELQAASVELQGQASIGKEICWRWVSAMADRLGAGRCCAPKPWSTTVCLTSLFCLHHRKWWGLCRTCWAVTACSFGPGCHGSRSRVRKGWTSTSMASRCRLPTCAFRQGRRRCTCTCRPGHRCSVIQADDFFAYGEQHQAGYVVNLQALHDLRAVSFHGLDGQAQARSDLPGGLAAHDQAQDLKLP